MIHSGRWKWVIWEGELFQKKFAAVKISLIRILVPWFSPGLDGNIGNSTETFWESLSCAVRPTQTNMFRAPQQQASGLDHPQVQAGMI